MKAEVIIKIMEMQKMIGDRYNEGVSPDEEDLLTNLSERLEGLKHAIYKLNNEGAE